MTRRRAYTLAALVGAACLLLGNPAVANADPAFGVSGPNDPPAAETTWDDRARALRVYCPDEITEWGTTGCGKTIARWAKKNVRTYVVSWKSKATAHITRFWQSAPASFRADVRSGAVRFVGSYHQEPMFYLPAETWKREFTEAAAVARPLGWGMAPIHMAWHCRPESTVDLAKWRLPDGVDTHFGMDGFAIRGVVGNDETRARWRRCWQAMGNGDVMIVAEYAACVGLPDRPHYYRDMRRELIVQEPRVVAAMAWVGVNGHHCDGRPGRAEMAQWYGREGS